MPLFPSKGEFSIPQRWQHFLAVLFDLAYVELESYLVFGYTYPVAA